MKLVNVLILTLITLTVINSSKISVTRVRRHVGTKEAGVGCQYLFFGNECKKGLSCVSDGLGVYKCRENGYKGEKKKEGTRCMWRFFENECEDGLNCTRDGNSGDGFNKCTKPKQAPPKPELLKKQQGEECKQGMIYGSDCDKDLKCEEIDKGNYRCQYKEKPFGVPCKTRKLPEFFGKDCAKDFSCLEAHTDNAALNGNKEKALGSYFCLVPTGKKCLAHKECGSKDMCDSNCVCNPVESSFKADVEQCKQGQEDQGNVAQNNGTQNGGAQNAANNGEAPAQANGNDNNKPGPGPQNNNNQPNGNNNNQSNGNNNNQSNGNNNNQSNGNNNNQSNGNNNNQSNGNNNNNAPSNENNGNGNSSVVRPGINKKKNKKEK